MVGRADQAEAERDQQVHRVQEIKAQQEQQAQQIKQDMQTIREEWNKKLQST